MDKISSFEIKGLFGNRDIKLIARDGVLILVGPNGAGKSTVINVFYFFISRQWDRLLEYTFSELAITAGDEEIRASREHISTVHRLTKAFSEISPTSRPGRLIERLRASNLLEEFIFQDTLKPPVRKRFADLLSVPTSEIHALHGYLVRRLPDPEIISGTSPRVELERALAELSPGRALYLPTYRRIEKDLQDIFPGFEEKLKRFITNESGQVFGRSASHFIDLVSFGMEDVRENIDRRTSGMRDYSLKQYNELSALYLRDVIRGKGEAFTAKEINDLTDARITEILGRVDEAALPSEDKQLLLKKVKSIQRKKKSDIAIHDRFLAHYFSRLVAVSEDIAKRENDIASFVDVCNAYLNPAKSMIYDEIAFTIRIEDERGETIDLSALSSGEKQIVSIFSHLYLDEPRDQVIVIDEPELSLSVPWQKRFLPDILASGRCSFLAAVTHSPFIYDNELRADAVDLRRMTTISGV